MRDRFVRRECRRFVRALDLPRVVSSIRDLLPFVEECSGRRIILSPAPPGCEADGPCGMWLRTNDVDYVFYRATTSRQHQDHIIAHELAHILRGHKNSALPQPVPVAERLVHRIDPSTVRMLLGRTEYTYRDEYEAELIASELQHRIRQRNTRPELDHADAMTRTLLRPRE